MYTGLVGNVGIGTADPAQTLDVLGNVHASGEFIAGATTNYGDGSITLSLGTNLDVDSGTLFVDNMTNSVGIGTTAPAAKLHVVGDVTIEGSVTGVTTIDTGQGPAELFAMDQNLRTTDSVTFGAVDAAQFTETGSGILSNDISGNAATATALEANGFNCAVGSYPRGVDTRGNAEFCTSVGDDISGNAATATALEANGFNCAAGRYARGVDARGNAEFCTSVGDDISGNAATATALAADGSDCGFGRYARGVDALGNAEGCTIDDDAPDSDSEVPNSITIDNGTLFVEPGPGGVGVGTTKPAALLHIVKGENDAANAALRITGLNNRLNLVIDGNEIDMLDAGLLINSNSEWNVGIGTKRPTAMLDVAGEVNAEDFTYSTSQTKYLMIAGSQCQGSNLVTTPANSPFFCRLGDGPSDTYAYWSVNLPNGATVTGFRVHAFSVSGTITCELRRGTNNRGNTMATVARSSVGWGWTTEDTTIILNPINASIYAYGVVCTRDSLATFSHIGAIQIRYQMPGPY